MIRSDNTIVNNLVTYLKNNGGSAEAVEVCREVMGFRNCEEPFAKELVRKGLPEDHRIFLDKSGRVQLARPRRKAKQEQPLSQCGFVVVDVEATSLPKPNNRIIELAAIQLDYQTIGPRYETLINPGTPIPKYVQQMTGITNDAVQDAPPFETVAGDIRSFIGDRVIIAHNSAFDVGIINSEFRRLDNSVMSNRALCTVKLSRKLLPGLDRYRLGEVSEYFNIAIENRHRATDDALAAARIFTRLMAIAEEEGKTTLESLLKIGGLRNNARW